MCNSYVTPNIRKQNPTNSSLKIKQTKDLGVSACEWHHVNMAAREMHWQGHAVIGNEQCQKRLARNGTLQKKKRACIPLEVSFCDTQEPHVLHTWQAKAGSMLIKGTKRPSVSLHANERQPLRKENPFK